MKKHRLAVIFLSVSLVLLITNIVIIIVFSSLDMESQFYSALNVASLSISFINFIVSSFFSLSVYLQARSQNLINESLPKKDDQYIIANYSLFNIETEMTFFSLTDAERDELIKKKKLLSVDGGTEKKDITRLVFLPTDSMNKPTYKVLVRSVSFCSQSDKRIYTANADGAVDGEYSSNILKRGYNCFTVDIAEEYETTRELISNSKYIELNLDIISAFNVDMNATFFIYLDSEKDVSNNPDKKLISDLRTYIIHHSNFVIQNKSILTK